MAKAFAPAVAEEATGLALEVLGEAGARQDHYVEKLYRDVKAMDIVEGPARSSASSSPAGWSATPRRRDGGYRI